MAAGQEEYKFPDEVAAKAAPEEPSLEIEVEDDTPPADRNKERMAKPVDEVTDDELASYDEKVQKRIKRFTKGYHDERRAKEEAFREREAAENFAKQMFEENKKLKGQVAVGTNAFVSQNKESAQSALTLAKAAYKKAYETADPDAIAEAQEHIARAAMRLEKAESLAPVKAEPDETVFQPPRERQEPRPPPRAQEWAEENKAWWGKDHEMTATALGLDKKLQEEYGASYIGTEEYFQTIDRTIRRRFPEKFGSQETPEERSNPAPRASVPANVVAPASRSTPPNRIRLKASQVAVAKRLGVPLELYAKKVAELERGV